MTSENTLVCIFLRGGADTLNMVVPYGDDDYYKMRPTIALEKPGKLVNNKSCVKATDFYGFHPAMSALLPSFHEGRLAIVQGVGSDNVSGSHFFAQDQMEHGESMRRTVGGGWLGRYLSNMDGPSTALSAVAIGSSVPESLRGAPNVSALRSVEEVVLKAPAECYQSVYSALQKLYSSDASPMVASAGEDTLQLMTRIKSLKSAEYKPERGVTYPDTDFARGLREVARLIKAELGVKVASIDLGGWDTHFVQGNFEGLQAGLIQQFGDGLAAFDADMRAVRDRVHVLVLTEFGRRTYENSSLGTDHGRGFAAFVLSAKAHGGRVVGDYPGLAEQPAEFLLGPSGLSVKLDYREVLAEVLTGAMGCEDTTKVFPDLKARKIGLF